MNSTEQQAMRQFATEVVVKLRDAGFEAVLAGGCVRDQLLNRIPKDFDVASNATPDEIRTLFGRRWTLAIGASFGVITVLHRSAPLQIEVATFRSDGAYTDGRRPDEVVFSSMEQDAQRRDFTINGLFFDPVDERVIDYVGGRDDLQRRIIRAIGDPHERISEDKLRMMRAVRFAATIDFELESHTLEAVRQHAGEIHVVSAERIAVEMRRMLVHENRTAALALLRDTGLLGEILPETADDPDGRLFDSIQRLLQQVHCAERSPLDCLVLSLAALILPLVESSEDAHGIARRWKLANEERSGVAFLLKHYADIHTAEQQPWPKIQRLLIKPLAALTVDFAAIVAAAGFDFPDDPGASETANRGIEFCRERLEWPREQLDPPPLIDGNSLIQAGIPSGPRFKQILTKVRDAQLLGQINSSEEALEMAARLSG